MEPSNATSVLSLQVHIEGHGYSSDTVIVPLFPQTPYGTITVSSLYIHTYLYVGMRAPGWRHKASSKAHMKLVIFGEKSSQLLQVGQFGTSSLLLPCHPLKKVKESKDLQTVKRLGPYTCVIVCMGPLAVS